MAKYRHPIFEMYEYRHEAVREMTPKVASPVTDDSDLKPWTFKYLDVSRLDGITHVQFKNAEEFGAEQIEEFRVDCRQLADRLVRNSKVLFDFANVKAFSAESIDELVRFNQTLKIKGSRMALSGLEPETQKSFFK